MPGSAVQVEAAVVARPQEMRAQLYMSPLPDLQRHRVVRQVAEPVQPMQAIPTTLPFALLLVAEMASIYLTQVDQPADRVAIQAARVAQVDRSSC